VMLCQVSSTESVKAESKFGGEARYLALTIYIDIVLMLVQLCYICI
jgi:hypothetical protein